MNIPEIEPIAGAVSAQIERAAQAAYDELLRLIDAGTDPRRAVEQVLTTFNGAYVTALSEAFSQVMQQRVAPSSVLAMPVGEVYLSARLYDAVQQTQGEVAAIVRQHAQGLHDARQLARRLYDGYNPQDGIQRPLEGSARAYLPKALRELTANPAARQSLQQVLEQMQAQAGRLKSEALKAGYMELLDAWAKGRGREVLQKRLWVAQREKTRYMADRIAQTELARAYTDRVAGQIMADETVEVVQVRLNPRHPLPDICDLHAKANLWGLGPGIYPKAKAPKPPFHPHCWCRLSTRPDLSAAQAQAREDGAREWLRTLPPADAARVLGNRDRLDMVLAGADWEKVTQAGVRAEYRLQRLGDNLPMREFRQPSETFGPYDPGAPKVKPDTSTPARRAAVEIEDIIRRDALETGAFVAPDGRVLLQRQGQPDRIAFLEGELLQMRGSTFTHNHPGGASFSVGDVETAKFAALLEVRAVTAEFRHIMRDLSKVPPVKVIETFRQQTQEALLQTVYDMAKRGIIRPVDAQKEVEHQFWVALSQRFGFLYRREKS